MERKLKSSNPQNWELEDRKEESFGTFIRRMRKLNGWSQDALLREPYLKGKTDEWLKKECLEILNLEAQNPTREEFIGLVLAKDIAKKKKIPSEKDKKKMIEDLLLDVLRLKSKEPQKKKLIHLVAACKNELQATQHPEETSKKNKKGLSKSRLSSIERDIEIEKRSKEKELIRPKKDTLEFLAEVLEIPMLVMEAKLDQKPIPWKEILIEQHYSAEQLMQARKVIEDALLEQRKKKEEESNEEGEQ